MKSPILKKWWFWVILVFVVPFVIVMIIGIFAVIFESPQDKAKREIEIHQKDSIEKNSDAYKINSIKKLLSDNSWKGNDPNDEGSGKTVWEYDTDYNMNIKMGDFIQKYTYKIILPDTLIWYGNGKILKQYQIIELTQKKLELSDIEFNHKTGKFLKFHFEH
ncbi:MAG: hypothetical protein NT007_03195 [Candidatus Kapabacteria bacterium]|nr:hypothetical protein [Candidatus Kapabacteria bacterium]